VFIGESTELSEKSTLHSHLWYYQYWSETLGWYTDPYFPLSLNYSHWEKLLISPSSLEAPRTLLNRFTHYLLT